MSSPSAAGVGFNTPAEDARLLREMITPEGVDLRIRLASAGQRAGAFLLDGAIIVGVLIVLSLAAVALAATTTGPTHGASLKAGAVIWLLGFFVLRNGWFLGFELSPRAATPGKRVFKLQVAARNGGRLTADALIARNAMREIEIFLPLSFLLANAAGIDGWLVVLGLAWTGILALFPLFNRDRLRVGDLVAGTWVVRRPQRRLLADLTEARIVTPFAFTDAQLDAYGVKELHVLEDVLRQNSRPALQAVAERIRGKVGWARRPDESDGAFLDAYYAALRARLEARLLIGKRRRDKFDVG